MTKEQHRNRINKMIENKNFEDLKIIFMEIRNSKIDERAKSFIESVIEDRMIEEVGYEIFDLFFDEVNPEYAC